MTKSLRLPLCLGNDVTFHSLASSLPPSLPPLFPRSLTHAPSRSLTPSLPPHSLTHILTHTLSLPPSSTQSPTHSLTHSITLPHSLPPLPASLPAIASVSRATQAVVAWLDGLADDAGTGTIVTTYVSPRGDYIRAAAPVGSRNCTPSTPPHFTPSHPTLPQLLPSALPCSTHP